MNRITLIAIGLALLTGCASKKTTLVLKEDYYEKLGQQYAAIKYCSINGFIDLQVAGQGKNALDFKLREIRKDEQRLRSIEEQAYQEWTDSGLDTQEKIDVTTKNCRYLETSLHSLIAQQQTARAEERQKQSRRSGSLEGLSSLLLPLVESYNEQQNYRQEPVYLPAPNSNYSSPNRYETSCSRVGLAGGGELRCTTRSR